MKLLSLMTWKYFDTFFTVNKKFEKILNIFNIETSFYFI